jgi:hypothetical protein
MSVFIFTILPHTPSTPSFLAFSSPFSTCFFSVPLPCQSPFFYLFRAPSPDFAHCLPNAASAEFQDHKGWGRQVRAANNFSSAGLSELLDIKG